MFVYKSSLACFTIVAGIFAATAAAQEVAGLEEIVVTAQKRSENINNVGMQITAISGATLDSLHITSPADFANLVPGLSYTNTEYNTPVYTLRGIGYYDPALSAEPAVSVYMDEFPLPYSTLTKHSFFDLDRVEILKGPQGTLYGENSTGGAINYIARKPTSIYSAGAEVSYGNYNRSTIDGFVSGPLTNGLDARLAVRHEGGNGWQDSTTRPGDTNGHVNNTMARLLLDYQANDSLKLSLNINGWIDQSDPQAAQYVANAAQFPGFETPSQVNEPFAPPKDTAANWSPLVHIHANNRFWQAALRADYSLAKDITLTTLSSFDHYQQSQADDQDGMVALHLDRVIHNGYVRDFVQELRLSVDTIKNNRFLIGANFENGEVDEYFFNLWNGTSAAQFFTTFGYPVTTVAISTEQTKKSYAGFINDEYNINSVTLRAGVRYTKTEETGRSCESDPVGGPGNTGNFFYDVVFGGSAGPYPGSGCLAGNDLGHTVNGVAPGAPGEYAGTLDQHNVSYRVGADWHVTDTFLAYLNVAKGYKAGGFPTVAASAFIQYEPVSQESLLAYDTGFKASFLDHRVQLNGAIFYYDYVDKQILARVIDPVFGVLAVLQNIPKSSVKGAEIEIATVPVQGLNLSLSYTYLDATIDKFEGINGAGVTGDFAGTPVPYTPRNQAAFNIDYEVPAFAQWKAGVGATVTYRTDTISVVGGQQNVPPPAYPQTFNQLGIDGYTLLDLRAGLRSDDGHWRTQIWGKNVLNRYYWNNTVFGSDAIVRFAGMPRTYGVTVGYQF
jgi:outer membrane receptor protein involved in Fe transport